MIEPFFFSSHDGLELSGIWTIPNPVTAAALILPGSGNVDHDGDISGPFLGKPHQSKDAKLSKQLAEALSLLGIASLRYSKRDLQTIPHLSEDAKVAFDLLKLKFPSVKRAIVGFSEGAALAMLVAKHTMMDGLFLLSPLARPMDEILRYQFFTWPVQLLSEKLDPSQMGYLDMNLLPRHAELKLPVTGESWETIDREHNSRLSILESVIPYYKKVHASAEALVKTPALSPWYESMLQMEDFASLAAMAQTEHVFLYQGQKDAQISYSWIRDELKTFQAQVKLRIFMSLGHCFSPMEGILGEKKTSGPFAIELLDQIKDDLKKTLLTPH